MILTIINAIGPSVSVGIASGLVEQKQAISLRVSRPHPSNSLEAARDLTRCTEIESRFGLWRRSRVLLFDLEAEASKSLGLSELIPSASGVLNGIPIDWAIRKTKIRNLDAVPGLVNPRHPAPTDLPPSESLRDALKRKVCHDFHVIACDNTPTTTTGIRALAASDAYVVTLQPGHMVIDQLSRTVKAISHAKAQTGSRPDFLGFLIVNAKMLSVRQHGGLARLRFGNQVFRSEIPEAMNTVEEGEPFQCYISAAKEVIARYTMNPGVSLGR